MAGVGRKLRRLWRPSCTIGDMNRPATWWTNLLGKPRKAGGAAARHERQPDVDEFTLDTMRTVPEVAAELASAPDVWRNCSYRDDENPDELDMPMAELLGYAYVSAQRGEWTFAVADELKPALDLDADEDTDAILTTLRAHPLVADAYHEDREVYIVEVADALPVEQAAALAARALVAGHRQALRAAGLST